MKKQRDVESLAVQLAIERTEAGISTGMLANHDLQAALLELVRQFAAVEGGVSDESPTLRILDELLSNSGLVALAGPQRDNQRPHSQVHDDMNFRRKAPRQRPRLLIRPPRYICPRTRMIPSAAEKRGGQE